MGTIYLHTLYDLPFCLNNVFLKILGIIQHDMMCPIQFRNFSHFWVKLSHCICGLSKLTGWIFISYVFNHNSWNLAYFLRPYTLESPKLQNSIYVKLTFKESTDHWIGLYFASLDKKTSHMTLKFHFSIYRDANWDSDKKYATVVSNFPNSIPRPRACFNRIKVLLRLRQKWVCSVDHLRR